MEQLLVVVPCFPGSFAVLLSSLLLGPFDIVKTPMFLHLSLRSLW
jgi:hypothetical protein